MMNLAGAGLKLAVGDMTLCHPIAPAADFRAAGGQKAGS
jgi:hypothetical protein